MSTSTEALTIDAFPPDYLDEHMHWHMSPPSDGGRQITPGQPGSGAEFLAFHRGYIRKVLRWYYARPGANLDAVAPWGSVPDELKTDPDLQFDMRTAWTTALATMEQRILRNDFATADELGIAIESTIHNYMHNAGAAHFHDSNLGDPSTAPLSSYFYQLHGLIDYWWARWEFAHGNSAPPLHQFAPLPNGRAVDIAVGPNGPWVLGTARNGNGDYPVYHWNGSSWDQKNGWGTHIAVSPEGRPWLIDHSNAILRWNDSTESFAPIAAGGRAISLGVGSNDDVWVIGTGGNGAGGNQIFHLQPGQDIWSGGVWRLVPGAAVEIKVTPSGMPWVVTAGGEIYEWLGDHFDRTSGCAARSHDSIALSPLAVSNAGSFVLGCDEDSNGNAGVFMRTESSASWVFGNGRAAHVAVEPSGMPWVVTSDGTIWQGQILGFMPCFTDACR